MATESESAPSNRKIVSTRAFDAPRELDRLQAQLRRMA